MFPPGTRGRARGLPYTMDAFMLGMGMLSESTEKSAHAPAGEGGGGEKRKKESKNVEINLQRYIMSAEKTGPINIGAQDRRLCTYKASTGGGKSDIKTKAEASRKEKRAHQRNNGESSLNMSGSRHGGRRIFQTKA